MVTCNMLKLLVGCAFFLICFQYAYAQQQDGYQPHEPIPTPRQEAAVVNIDKKIYVIGGFSTTGRESIDVVEVYDTENDSWSTLSSLPKKLNHPAAAAYDGKIYVVGGMEYTYPVITHWVATNYLFIYDPFTDQWTRGADMPTARGALTAQFIDGTLYAVGGENTIQWGIAQSIFDQVTYPVNEAYHPETDSWEKKALMPTPRNHVASAVVDGKLYVIGGRQKSSSDNFNTNEVYDPKTDTWSALEPMPTARSGITASTLNGTIFVFGGEDGKKALDINQQFIPEEGWFTHTPMSIGLHALGSATVEYKIYLMGGSPLSGGGWKLTTFNESYYNLTVIPEFGFAVYLLFGVSLIPIIIYSRFGKNYT